MTNRGFFIVEQISFFCYNKNGDFNDEINYNYVWYSGKLWRIVALNNNGTIKMVTDENITTISWGANTTYKGSWMYQWLNEDFKDTLYNYEELLVKEFFNKYQYPFDLIKL